jgi:hypothetical protein
MARDLDKILAAAVELIDPPEDSIEAFRAQLKARIECARQIHQETANLPPPGEMRDRAVRYLKKLLATKKAVRAFHQPAHSPSRTYPWDDLLAALDQEIIRVDVYTCLVVRKDDGPQRDQATDLAVILARDLIDPDPYRHPENRGKDFPPIDCPWRRCAALTRGGAWLTLASLIYESVTGTRGRDMMEYCRQIEKRQPRYVDTDKRGPPCRKHFCASGRSRSATASPRGASSAGRWTVDYRRRPIAAKSRFGTSTFWKPLISPPPPQREHLRKCLPRLPHRKPSDFRALGKSARGQGFKD